MLNKVILQPPSGGCVLKPNNWQSMVSKLLQPPSGGCVLKLDNMAEKACPIWSSRLRAAVC